MKQALIPVQPNQWSSIHVRITTGFVSALGFKDPGRPTHMTHYGLTRNLSRYNRRIRTDYNQAVRFKNIGTARA